ncbi:sensor histidine kinase [Herbaspirillum sp. alder98]|uniref:sensor histidine kinase n=1 Tax=Herbaspirillum sp. alder98 TaxID=2913096 RepID=UPI001CD837F5|nr:ATP-binding protein [Herbaspirillum sp. alder98]MCA1326996.1 HAMP domain-containing protein [Herbaspirillum sp. alder98]
MPNAIEHLNSTPEPRPGYLGLSFRQLLLAAFLLIAGLLSATSIHALFTLERMASNSSQTARQAVQLTEAAQRLAERTVAMERSARQYLVLDDPVFHDRFVEARDQARQAINELSDALPLAPRELYGQWTLYIEEASAVLESEQRRDKAEQLKVFQDFSRLPALNERLALESRREVDRRNNALSTALEQQRRMLTLQVVGAILLAVLLAFCFGLWLSRPLARLEHAIGRLGDNRFDQPIDVRGPADIRRLGQQLDWLRLRLADLEAEKSRFLRHVSHELKTPLAALCEGAALLDDGVAGQLSDNQREIARILRQNTQSLQTQIEDLLRYNELAFDAQRLHPVPVDLRALLHKVIDDQRLQWLARELRVEVDGSARMVLVDPEKMAIALANLLSNAVRFSPEGGFIRFLLADVPGAVRVECIDQGPGVAPTDTARIFEPFYQGLHQPSGARRGNGIGLSVVREYVHAHGGRVQLVPRDGGAHFRIELPDEKQD